MAFTAKSVVSTDELATCRIVTVGTESLIEAAACVSITAVTTKLIFNDNDPGETRDNVTVTGRIKRAVGAREVYAILIPSKCAAQGITGAHKAGAVCVFASNIWIWKKRI